MNKKTYRSDYDIIIVRKYELMWYNLYRGVVMKNKKIIWQILLFIGILSFAVPILLGIISFFTGFSFLSAYATGFEALFSLLAFWSFLFWQTYIIGIILIIVSIIKLKKIKNN